MRMMSNVVIIATRHYGAWTVTIGAPFSMTLCVNLLLRLRNRVKTEVLMKLIGTLLGWCISRVFLSVLIVAAIRVSYSGASTMTLGSVEAGTTRVLRRLLGCWPSCYVVWTDWNILEYCV